MKIQKRNYFGKSVLKTLIYILLISILAFALAGCGSGSSGSSNGQTQSSQPAAGSITLLWNAPTANSDGTPLTDLAGYKIYYGTMSNQYTSSIDIGNTTNYTIGNLSEGTYYFTIVAYDTSGNESDPSAELSVYISQS